MSSTTKASKTSKTSEKKVEKAKVEKPTSATSPTSPTSPKTEMNGEVQPVETSKVESKSKSKRKTALYWTPDRDLALVTAMVEGDGRLDKIALYNALKDDPSFVDAGEGFSANKCRDRVNKLRNLGVDIPSIARPAGGGRTRYSPDAERLNEVVKAMTAKSEE